MKPTSIVLLQRWLSSRADRDAKKAALSEALNHHAVICQAVGSALTPPNLNYGETIAIRFTPEELEGISCSPDATSLKEAGTERILYIKKERGRDQPTYLLSWK